MILKKAKYNSHAYDINTKAYKALAWKNKLHNESKLKTLFYELDIAKEIHL